MNATDGQLTHLTRPGQSEGRASVHTATWRRHSTAPRAGLDRGRRVRPAPSALGEDPGGRGWLDGWPRATRGTPPPDRSVAPERQGWVELEEGDFLIPWLLHIPMWEVAYG
jgi:hypothetical protein